MEPPLLKKIKNALTNGNWETLIGLIEALNIPETEINVMIEFYFENVIYKLFSECQILSAQIPVL